MPLFYHLIDVPDLPRPSKLPTFSNLSVLNLAWSSICVNFLSDLFLQAPSLRRLKVNADIILKFYDDVPVHSSLWLLLRRQIKDLSVDMSVNEASERVLKLILELFPNLNHLTLKFSWSISSSRLPQIIGTVLTNQRSLISLSITYGSGSTCGTSSDKYKRIVAKTLNREEKDFLLEKKSEKIIVWM